LLTYSISAPFKSFEASIKLHLRPCCGVMLFAHNQKPVLLDMPVCKNKSVGHLKEGFNKDLPQ
jgi:hypothetical protein